MVDDSEYVMGESAEEYARLMLQGRMLRPYTERIFQAAGVGQGMRVLELGSGVGDVALLLADMVGPGGCVVGVDRDDAALDVARRRVVEQGCESWVRFEAERLEGFVASEKFDAVVGRYVLLFQPDAAAVVRRYSRMVRPGGIVAFHELDMTDARSSYPACELWDELLALFVDVFDRWGVPSDFGRRLGKTFLDAGLEFPEMTAERPVGGDYIFHWLAGSIVSLAPRLKELGLQLPDGVVADGTLAGRLEEAARGSQIVGSTQYGAWVRVSLIE